MKSFRVLALSAAFALLTVGSAYADIDTETFTIGSLSGPLAGNSYTGSFTFDTTTNTVTAFSTDFPSWTDAMATYGSTLADLNASPSGGGLENFFAPGPVGNPDAFAFFGGSPSGFTYGTTDIVQGEFVNAGDGTVTYGPIVDTTPTPEPGSFLLLASGLAGMVGTVRRRLKA